MTADHRSVHPNVPGVPWWAAVLIAATTAAAGFAYDAGSGGKELTGVFAAAYVVGCVAAVLAVRQSGIFTAVIQPPLLLFVSVPGAYWLFHGASFTGIKDTLINCGYPLIERFPLMLFTSAGVLLIGMARWYMGMTRRGSAAKAAADDKPPEVAGRFAAATAKVSALFSREPADEDDEEVADEPRRKHSIDRPARAGRSEASTARAARTGKRAEPSRSRHVRPPETEIIEPVTERPRRPRTRASDLPSELRSEPRRRPRTTPREPRENREPREPGSRLPPREAGRRNLYERSERSERPERRRRRIDDFEPYEPPQQRSRQSTNGSNGTHHPISRVRYRGSEEDATREEYRRRRPPRHREAETWEYDI
ncbi:MAG: hypothetical protein JWR37_4273 [Mycobacterium sp.]|nr:hypothetical protein [Mycobacterium sp.]